MAKALADTWRIRILVEVTVRPLSPSQFVENFGGDLTRISRSFRQLAKWGYIEKAEERLGRRRGAAIEHIYRAVRRAHFDTASWETVPRSKRDQVSWSVLSSYFFQIRNALESGTFDEDLDRHLSWDAVALDSLAWRQLGKRLDELLASFPGLEHEARTRAVTSDIPLIPTVIGLNFFRSPQSTAEMLQAPRRDSRPSDAAEPGALFGIEPRLAKALSNKWRSRILMEVSIRPMSPTQFLHEIGGSKSNVSRCFRELSKWGYIELIEERRGGRLRGGVEKIYKSTCRAYFDTPTWSLLPRVVRDEISLFILESYFSHIVAAVNAGTFDADTDRHLSWKPILLDSDAWKAVGKALDDLLEWVPLLEAESIARVKGDLDLLIPTIVGLTMFRIPQQPQAFHVVGPN